MQILHRKREGNRFAIEWNEAECKYFVRMKFFKLNNCECSGFQNDYKEEEKNMWQMNESIS